MATVKYNIAELVKVEGFDAAGAVKSFDNCQDYFDKLSDFTKNSRNYLRAYTPSVVIYSSDVCRQFLDELEKTKEFLTTLGMTLIAIGLKSLESAIKKSDAGILSDGLIKFYADMDIMTKHIVAAQLPDDGTPVAVAAEKKLIFAVDDSPVILTMLTDMLEDTYEVITMSDSETALKALETLSPALFLLDIEMPAMSGYELATAIRTQAKFKNIPIVFLTGNSSREAVMAALSHGGNGYLLKPVDKNKLLDKIILHLKK